jgi:hypothetical protein
MLGPQLRQLALITGRVTIEPHGTDGAIKIIVEHGDGKFTQAIRAIRFAESDEATEGVIQAAIEMALKHVTTTEPPNAQKIAAERAAREASRPTGIPDRGDLPFVM